MDISEIAKVELLGTSEEAQAEGMRKVFYLKTVEGNKMYVPLDEPSNRHYQAIRTWYEAQEVKPFEFEFPAPIEDGDRGEFAPPAEFEVDEEEEINEAPETTPVPEEPETLMPR